MTEQIHKRLVDGQMKAILRKYVTNELKASEAMELLGLRRRQFFEWVQRYRQDPEGCTLEYRRKEATRKIEEGVEAHILAELARERVLIDDPSLPVCFYNYSYVQDQMQKNYGEKVSLPTIIERAKKTVFTSRGRREPSTIMRSSRIMPENSFSMTPPTIDGLRISRRSFT